MGKLSMVGIEERKALVAAIVEPIIVGARDRKVAGTYKRITPGNDGRIRTMLSPDTASNRLSSSDTPLYPSTNLQNQEKKVAGLDPLYRVRDVFIADKDMLLIAGDYSGAETVGVAAYSQDWPYLEKLLSGADTHTELAEQFWGAIPEEGKLRKLRRDTAKTIRYASFYYAKVPTITVNLNKEADALGRYFTQQEVHDLLQIIYQNHPLQQWWGETREALAKNGGALRNCFGYRRCFYDPNPDNRLKDALSFLPQSTVGSLMNKALPLIHNAIDKPGSRELLHQIHDEVLGQCRPEEISFVIETATPIMERPFTVNGRELYIPVEWKVGFDWGHMEKVTSSTAEEVWKTLQHTQRAASVSSAHFS